MKPIWDTPYGVMLGYRTTQNLTRTAWFHRWDTRAGLVLALEFDLDGDGTIDCRESHYSAPFGEPANVRVRPGAEPLVVEFGGKNRCTADVRPAPTAAKGSFWGATGTPP